MSLTQRHELNNPPIIAEVVEGEVIAIDLDRGSYYSFVAPSARIWSAIVAGHSGQEILASMTPLHDADQRTADLLGFLDTLLAEQLIRPKADGATPGALLSLPAWSDGELRFERFTDMQDLLVLDPIHEVDDEAGWPKPLKG